MKLKNRFKVYSVSILGLLLINLSACDKFLEEDPKSILSPANFPQSANDANLILGGITRAVALQDFVSFSLQMVNSVTTDEANVTFASGDRYDLDQYVFPTNNIHIDNVYKTCYRVINQSNLMIKSLPSDKAFAKPYIAAAKFYRAWMYSYLVNLYGPSIIREQPTEQINAGEVIVRSSEKEVYDLIVRDLSEAEVDLPNKWTTTAKLDDGRPTKAAAKMLLAETYLRMAGNPINDASKWALALSKSKEIIDMNMYSLEPKFSDLFLIAKKNGPEHVFSVQQAESEGFLTVLFYPSGGGINPAGFWVVTGSNEALNTFPNNDDRKAATFATQIRNPNGTIIQSANFLKNANYAPVPAVQKFLDYGRANFLDFGRRTLLTFPVFRYSEAFLIRAEAENEVNGPTLIAKEAINVLRRRANADLIDVNAVLTKDQLRDIIRKEWTLEFAYELKRRFNLIRWGQLDQVLSTNERSKRGYVAYKKYFPIPQSEFDAGLDPKLQTAGY
jgi:starch-binding outer membrane protein, SusD/RagB family